MQDIKKAISAWWSYFYWINIYMEAQNSSDVFSKDPFYINITYVLVWHWKENP